MHGVWIVDKPQGITSFDVVARMRRALKTKAVGHTGTLDPMATGVLVVCVGEATKLAHHLTQARKSYVATLTLGTETDSLDADGAVVRQCAVPSAISAAQLHAVCTLELERTLQVPPSVSAIHVDGERAHALVRRGVSLTLAERSVQVDDLQLTQITPTTIQIAVTAAKGYYVRALGRDIATALGTCGHLSALQRTASGCFTLAEAVRLDSPSLTSHALSLTEAVKRALPWRTVHADYMQHVRDGKRVPAEAFSEREGVLLDSEIEAWLDAQGELLALGSQLEGGGKVLRGFAHAQVR